MQDSSPLVVVDTNVVFDWLVFREPGVAVLAEALEARRVLWIATEAMRQEFEVTLARGLPARPTVDTAACLAAWERFAQLQAAQEAPLSLPRCSDPDDQKFVELAVTTGAAWLVTRDKALLKLARRIRGRGTEILSPPAWTAAWLAREAAARAGAGA